jgi:ABC-type sugar transport system ATPase subunit
MPNTDFIIRTNGISKYYGSVVALDKVDFELRDGEVLGLVGDNGAGKSTLIKILSGAVLPNEGSIEVFGNLVHIRNPKDSFDLGIETIYQDLALFDNLNFTENIFAGRELKTKGIGWLFGLVDGKRMQREASNRIKNISINLPLLNQKVKQLSGGQRQAVAIIRALFWGQRILIMDEPTAALGVREARKVLDLISEMRKHVNGVIVITHNIEQIIDIADRVIVLRNGKRVGDIDFQNYENRLDDLHNDIVKLITGAELIDYKV